MSASTKKNAPRILLGGVNRSTPLFDLTPDQVDELKLWCAEMDSAHRNTLVCGKYIDRYDWTTQLGSFEMEFLRQLNNPPEEILPLEIGHLRSKNAAGATQPAETHSRTVITYTSGRQNMLSLCTHCIARIESSGESWPRDNGGSEYCTVSHGAHYGLCDMSPQADDCR